MNKLIQPLSMLSLLVALSSISHASQTCQLANVPATTPTEQFSDNGDGTVTDTKTGLMWKRCSEGQAWNGSTCIGNFAAYTWQTALQQAQSLNSSGGFAGKADWRVPNVKELRSIAELQCASPAINLTIFPATPSDQFWSSTPFAHPPGDAAWVVSFYYDGSGQWENKNAYSLPIRLVRGGQ